MSGFGRQQRLPRGQTRARRNAARLGLASEAGDGLGTDALGRLSVVAVAPIISGSSGIGLSYGNGLTLASGSLIAQGTAPISVGAGGIGLSYGNGLTVVSDALAVQGVAPITVGAGGVALSYSTGLSVVSGSLVCTITQYTDELAQDAVGTILDDGSVGTVVFSYDDGTPKISATLKNGLTQTITILDGDGSTVHTLTFTGGVLTGYTAS